MKISSSSIRVNAERAVNSLTKKLDQHIGALFSSSFEFPGRYTRWDVGFVDPPLSITVTAYQVLFRARNARGIIILDFLKNELPLSYKDADFRSYGDCLEASIHNSKDSGFEEHRTRRPSFFSILRQVIKLFDCGNDKHIGLYGAFGYDLGFQLEPIEQKLKRGEYQRDAVLYLPDRLLIVDHMANTAIQYDYEFSVGSTTTEGICRTPVIDPYQFVSNSVGSFRDHPNGEYAKVVEKAVKKFRSGDLFEVVPSQIFSEACLDPPSKVFRNLKSTNPAPYGALINLGQGEYLVSASPEMYVRVEGRRVETCPISGTIRRGRDALEDANNIRTLLNSSKDEAELTMCTDVDRNDKSRVCVPGTVRVIGRRQIETYSRLIHTVDHVEGQLRENYDALDAFLSHTWAVTVTGAPKKWAMQFIEDNEKSPRQWYGGAHGWIGFNGDINTGLLLRTIRMDRGRAEIRVGATLLVDSNPSDEDEECALKVSALLASLNAPQIPSVDGQLFRVTKNQSCKILIIDHEDSFVHTLAEYFRRTGASVDTVRYSNAKKFITGQTQYDLVVLSPGPSEPAHFSMNKTIEAALRRGIPIFGVCLGLQGLVTYFGGRLDVSEDPIHGRSSKLLHNESEIFKNLPNNIPVGRYHSLYVDRVSMPACLDVTAETDDGVVMAIKHKTKPIWAVQFHPESILSSMDDFGILLINNLLNLLDTKN